MHKADTVQAFCWKARSLAVRHQPSSRKHRLNCHRGCRRRQVNAGQLTEGWVNANTRILGPEVKYIIGRSSRGHITSDFDSSLETQQLVPIGRGKIYWVILGIKGLKQYWILKKFSYPVIPAVVDLILITVININQSSSQYRIYRGKWPKMTYLRVFCYLCLINIFRSDVLYTKWQRSLPCIHCHQQLSVKLKCQDRSNL